MPINLEETSIDAQEIDPEMAMVSPIRQKQKYTIDFPGAVKSAYRFDGQGNFFKKDWDLSEGEGEGFCWYHVELPRSNQKLAMYADYLIDVLCPPLKRRDIVSLVSKGTFCDNVDGALVFRVNSPGPTISKFTQRLAARISENTVITVSLDKVPRLGFSPSQRHYGERDEDVLEFLLTMNHSEEADNPVPTRVSNLLVHIVDTYVDHLQDIVTKFEMKLDTIELELHKGDYSLKKQTLDERRYPKTHLNLQHLLQVIAYGEQVFPRVKDKCAQRTWFAREDIGALEVLVDRLRRLKENVGFIVNRANAIQAGLDSWQAEQTNTKLYYLSFLSMIFLPLSIVPAVFGMNVGGVPWTGQKDHTSEDGFRNVLFICAAIFFLSLTFFAVAIREHTLVLNTKHTLTSFDG